MPGKLWVWLTSNCGTPFSFCFHSPHAGVTPSRRTLCAPPGWDRADVDDLADHDRPVGRVGVFDLNGDVGQGAHRRWRRRRRQPRSGVESATEEVAHREVDGYAKGVEPQCREVVRPEVAHFGDDPPERRNEQYPRHAVDDVDELERLGIGIEDQRPVVLVVLHPVRLPLHHLSFRGDDVRLRHRARAALAFGFGGARTRSLMRVIWASGAGGGFCSTGVAA